MTVIILVKVMDGTQNDYSPGSMAIIFLENSVKICLKTSEIFFENCDIDLYFQEQLVQDFDCWSHINHFGHIIVKT